MADLLDQIMRLGAGDLHARGEVSERSDDIDALVSALNMLAEDMLERERARAAAEAKSTHLSAYSRELERSNAALAEFAYAASHDLQEPLRMVTSYARLLEKRIGLQLDPESRSYLTYVTDGGQRMQQLVHGLLLYARAGAPSLAPSVVVATDLVRDVILDLRLSIEEARAEVSFDMLPTVFADATQLTVVFRNLLSNALKYRRENVTPVVRIAARYEEGFWIFSVQDNGIGIDPKYFARVFKLFQRLHPRHKYPGTGIGLALCKRIIEAHGGSIWVESTPQTGSTFLFSLPLTKP